MPTVGAVPVLRRGRLGTCKTMARNEPYQTAYQDGTSESIGTTPTNGYDANGNGTTTWYYDDGLHLTHLNSGRGRCCTGTTWTAAARP